MLRQREREQQHQGQHGEDTAEDPGGRRGKGRTRRQAERSPSPPAKLADTAVIVKGGRADDGVPDVIEGGRPGAGDETPIHLVVGELLSLVEGLVRFGKQCDRLHDAVQKPPRRGSSSGGGATGTGTRSSMQTQAAIRDLTFEVFAAMARLAVALSRESSFPSPEQMVLLLTTVRLPRITKLAAACEQKMMDDRMAGSGFSPSANTNTEQLVDDVAAAVVDRLKGLLGRQATQIATNGNSINQDLNSFSSSSEFQDQIRDAVRHEVKLQAHGTETASLRENGTPRRRSPWP